MSSVFIIAEAGVNHNGSVELAKRLIDVAKASGADAVKFQSFLAESLVSSLAEKAPYQKLNGQDDESQFEMLRRLELDERAHRELFDYGRRKGIVVVSTPFDAESSDMLDSLGVPFFKIGSGEVTNIPFLQHVAMKGKPIVLSTGMSTIDEVASAVHVIRAAGNKDITLLHCVSSYPAPLAEANIKAMVTMRESFNVNVGYSDHTIGVEASMAAVALGACVIEKHFTMDKKFEGPDHAASLDPLELQNFVELVRRMKMALGDGVKRPMQCELDNILIVRRSLFAREDIQKGKVIGPEMIESKRPAVGISPAELQQVVGIVARRDIRRGEMLRWDSVGS